MIATVLALTASVSASSPCGSVQIDAELAPGMRSISGHAVCVVATDGALQVAAYPRVLVEPTGLDDVSRHWVYPNGFSAAWMSWQRKSTSPAGGGGPPGLRGMLRIGRGRRGTAPLESEAAERDGATTDVIADLGHVRAGERVTVAFSTTIPERNGTLGRRRGVAYLLAGWHPIFGRRGAFAHVPMRFRVTVPAGMVGFAGHEPFGRQSERTRAGRFTGRYLPLLAAAQAHVERIDDVAVAVVPSGASAPAVSAQSLPYGLADITSGTDGWAMSELVASVRQGSEYAARHGLHGRFVLVVAPLLERLVERFEGGLVVSDRAFHLLPWERFLKFHRLSVWREQLALLAEQHSRRVETDLLPSLVADSVGAALRDALAIERYGGKESAPDLLEPFAIIPEIDALIFAPQVCFADTYYDAVDETSGARTRPTDFFHLLPRGKLLHEKLVDLIGLQPALQVAQRYLRTRRPWLQVASEVAGRDLQPQLRAWLGPYPQIDYGIGAVRSSDDRVTVQVSVVGPDAARVTEPVTVEVVDADGVAHRATRTGATEVSLAVPGPPRKVQIDPDGRLVELWKTDPGKSPRFNNRTPPRWRFLLNNISGLLGVTGGDVWVSVDFSLRRIHDLRYRWSFSASYGPDKVGTSAGVLYGFGAPVTPLFLGHRVGLFGSYQRLRGPQGELDGGHQVEASAYYGYDTRISPYWGFEGEGVNAVLSGAAGEGEDRDRHRFVQAGVGGLKIWPLAFGHALVGRLRADVMVGTSPAQEGLRLGGRYWGGRGFEADEAQGKRRVLGSFEYRHILQADTRTDLLGVFTWTRLEGALFADAIYLRGPQQTCDARVFYDVGYGLRLIGDVLGVQPASVAVDVGVPIRNRCVASGRGLPITVYVAFIQSFAAF